MNKVFTTLTVLILTINLVAQSPEKISYQAVIRDGSDILATNASIGMQISIIQNSINGTAVYIERHFPTTNVNGLVSIEIGTGTIVSGEFTTIDWGSDNYFIKTETDLNGGANYTITGTSQLLSVPYALHAKTAENISGTIDETDPVFSESIARGISDTDTSNWNNETDPEYTNSIAASITGIDTTNWNNKLDGYTETDPEFSAWDRSTGINITESQVSDLQNYLTTEVDGNVTNEIQDLANVLSQGADASNNIISNLANPVNDQDAATKAYVDLLKARISEMEGQLYNSGILKLKDYDGNEYATIALGNQIWMAENLKTTHYADGTAISGVYVYSNNENNAAIYGRIYTWTAAMNGETSSNENPSGIQGVCPSGWHLPSDEEWKELEMFLGMSESEANSINLRGTNEGSKLAGNSDLWNNGVLEDNAEFGTSGFLALPGGYRDTFGSFYSLGNYAYFWSATKENDGSFKWVRVLRHNYSAVIRVNYSENSFSVRCVKNN